MPSINLFSNNSITGIFLAAVFIVIISFFFCGRCSNYVITGVTIAAVILLLLFRSRASLIGFFCGLLYLLDQRGDLKKTKFILIASLLLTCIFLFFWKWHSSLGRIHIYDCSFTLLKRNWPAGIGIGKFKAAFNETQASYFSTHDINNIRALLADNTFYAFNEYLQWIIETGLTGLLILVAFIFLLVKRITCLKREKGNRPVLIAAQSGLLCIAVSSLFSYPLHTIPVQAITLILVGLVLFYPVNSVKSFFWKLTAMITKTAFVTLCLCFVYNTVNHIIVSHREKEAVDLQMAGYKKESMIQYRELTEAGHLHGYIFYFLAERMFYSNELSEAYDNIKKCLKYYSDNNVYRLKAQIEEGLEKYAEAEESLKKALYMVPNRIGNRYELMKFYIARQDTVNAKYWAFSILNMKIKVPSYKAKLMVNATKDSLAIWWRSKNSSTHF